MRTLTMSPAEFYAMTPEQRAVRRRLLRGIVSREWARHHARYHAAESHARLERAVAVHATVEQPRDQRGRFARGAS